MKRATLAPAYASIYPGLCDIARNRGYALAIHGSMVTDFDVVAIPWTPAACDPEELVGAIAEHIRRCVPEGTPDVSATPAQKPHGRRAWLIPFGMGAVIDFSVMPRAAEDMSEKKEIPDCINIPKPNQADLDTALQVMQLLANMSYGYYPSSDEGTPTYFDSENLEHLQFLHQRVVEIANNFEGVIHVICSDGIAMSKERILINLNDAGEGAMQTPPADEAAGP